MGIQEFVDQYRLAVSQYGWTTGTRLAAGKANERIIRRAGTKINFGNCPLDDQWDVMIIIDACRWDLFEEFAPKHTIYNKFSSISPRYSCASSSYEWFRKGFRDVDDEIIADVHYVSENPHIELANLSRFHHVTPLWKLRRESDIGVLNPAIVTDHALHEYQSSEAGRFIVHYIPPHAPFLHCPDKYQINKKLWDGDSQQVWKGIQTGDFNRDEVWQDYGKNLLTVLDEVSRLITHLSGSVVVTSDHGNALGEWGIYGHPSYMPIPAIKRVPWARTKGGEQPVDLNELELRELDSRADDELAEERLRQLGYLE